MLTKIRSSFILSLCLLLGVSCSGGVGGGTGTGLDNSLGGSEAGNPNPPALTRGVTGTIQEASGSPSSLIKALNKKAETSGDCAITEVRFVATSGESQDVAVANCAFEAELDIDQAYTLEFYNGDTLWAVAYFEPGEGLSAPYFYLSGGEGDVDLGFVIFSSTQARVTQNPFLQNDADDDGIDDFNDADDDNDGTDDSAEDDCNNDGIPDDYEENDPCGATSASLPPSDRDEDGVPDSADNCSSNPNADQTDTDADGAGDECDEDDDGDGVPEDGNGSGENGDYMCTEYLFLSAHVPCDDNCPLTPNPTQANNESPNTPQGDACE